MLQNKISNAESLYRSSLGLLYMYNTVALVFDQFIENEYFISPFPRKDEIMHILCVAY